MLFEFEFNTEEDRNKIINDNTNKYLISEKYLLNGKFLIFSDMPTIEILQQEQSNKISILEVENKNLKQELSVTQDAVNELILSSMSL